MSKFQNVPIELDTVVLGQEEVTIKNLTALKQNWSWDGIAGESLIFDSQDTRNMSDDELLAFINSNGIEISGQATFKRDINGYCFINFNFATF